MKRGWPVAKSPTIVLALTTWSCASDTKTQSQPADFLCVFVESGDPTSAYISHLAPPAPPPPLCHFSLPCVASVGVILSRSTRSGLHILDGLGEPKRCKDSSARRTSGRSRARVPAAKAKSDFNAKLSDCCRRDAWENVGFRAVPDLLRKKRCGTHMGTTPSLLWLARGRL